MAITNFSNKTDVNLIADEVEQALKIIAEKMVF